MIRGSTAGLSGERRKVRAEKKGEDVRGKAEEHSGDVRQSRQVNGGEDRNKECEKRRHR